MILDVFVLAKQQLQGLWAVRSHSRRDLQIPESHRGDLSSPILQKVFCFWISPIHAFPSFIL